MAITKLMHMKEASKGFPSVHLKNSIEYILDVKHFGRKTDYGKWVGGNAGTHADEIYQTFMMTKQVLGKEHGRQGYHFVISFPPEEADAQKVFDVAKEFCETYFGDDYEYVFAVHNDMGHKHAHIVFNSVSRTTGMKYRYEKGDWEKTIQPITDVICEKHGLSRLEFEKEKVNHLTYDRWLYKKQSKMNWPHIMMADIDYAISQSENLEEFYLIMTQMNYSLRFGNTEKHGQYIAYTLHGSQEEQKVTKRSYRMGRDYSLDGIKYRIEHKDEIEKYFHEEVADSLAKRMDARIGKASSIRSTKTYYRAYQAVSYYRLPNPFALPQYKIKKDILSLDKLLEECAYIKAHPDLENYHQRETMVQKKLKDLYRERDYLEELEKSMKETVSEEDVYRYRQLTDMLENATEWTDELEYAQDELEDLKENLPFLFFDTEAKLLRCKNNIEVLKKEKRMLTRILKTEEGAIDNIFIRPDESIKIKQ